MRLYRCLQRITAGLFRDYRLAGQGVALAVTPTVGFCRRAGEDHKARAPPGFSPEAEDCGYSSALLTKAKESLGWVPGLRLVSLAHTLDFTPLLGLQRVLSALAVTSPGPERQALGQPRVCQLCPVGLIPTFGEETWPSLPIHLAGLAPCWPQRAGR